MTVRIVFIDSNISEYQSFIPQLPENSEAVVLDKHRDGVLQILSFMQAKAGIGAIDIVSHGKPGSLRLGSVELCHENIASYAQQLTEIGTCLHEDAGILLYGCEVAQGRQGQAFIEQLALLTGANVAASTNLTGAQALGGDWILEARAGSIKTTPLQLSYSGVLATVTGTPGDDTLSGTAGDDELTGGTGNDTLNGGSGSDIATFSGNQADYEFSLNTSGQITVRDINPVDGDEGIDTLRNIEVARFADGDIGVAQKAVVLQVNTVTNNDQFQPSITALTDGGFVVSWASPDGVSSIWGSNSWSIYARRYDANGVAQGSEFRVNTYTANDQQQPSITALTDGKFVVSWVSYLQDGSGYGIYARRYDANGVAQGSEFRINTYTANDQLEPSITALADGGFAVSWASYLQDGNGYDIYAQRYDANGVAQGSEFRVNTYNANDQQQPSITALTGGGFVVSWVSNGQDGSSYGIYAQRYDANGVAQGSEFRVNTYKANDQQQPSITALTGGGFVVSWMSNGQDGSGYGIYAQRYNANGVAQGSEFQVNTSTTHIQQQPSITALTGGGFVVSWTSFGQDGSGYGIYAQRYDANGVAQGTEFQVNTYATHDQQQPAVTALADGGFVVSWTSFGQDGSGYGIYAQRYDADGNALGGITLTGSAGGDHLNVASALSEPVSLSGLAGHDVLQGGAGNDTLEGGSGNDTLAGGQGDDTLIDSEGDNVAVYAGNRSDYIVSLNKVGQITVRDTNSSNGNEGIDTLSYPMTLRFADGNFTVNILAVGSEFQVNTYTADIQQQPSITALADGGFVVSWVSNGQDGSGYGIYAQRYDANGVAQGSEFQVNTYTTHIQQQPSITVLTGGGFVVSWMSYGQDGSGYGIYAQRYDGNGVAQGSEFQVNTGTTHDQQQPSITALTDGGFVVSWMSYGQDGSGYGIYAQRYDANGIAQDSEFQVNTYTTHIQQQPSITALTGGGFVVSWTSFGQDGSSYGIYAQRYDANGVAQGSEFRVNTYTAGNQLQPSIAALSQGGFVVSWVSNGQDGSSDGIYAQRYDANGVAQGSEFRINTYTANDQQQPSIAALTDGGFVVSWVSYLQDGSIYGIYAKRYDADGIAQGNEFRVNTYTANDQQQPSIAALTDGGFVVSWVSNDQDDSGYGIYAQRYDATGNPVQSEIGLIPLSTVPTGSPTALLGNSFEDNAYTVSATDLLAGFTAGSDPLAVANLIADHGTVSDNGDGTFTITPEADYNGLVMLNYDVVNASSGDSIPAVQSFSLAAINDAPGFVAGANQVINEDAGAQTISGWASGLSAGPADEAGQALSFIVSNDNNALFSAAPSIDANGELTYTPAANAQGTVQVTVQIQDSGGTDNGGIDLSASQNFTITIDPLNDDPAGSATAVLAAGTEDTDYIVSTADLLQGFSDVDGDTLSISGLSADQGTVTDNGDGTYTISHTVNYNGTVNLSYTVEDGNGGSVAGSQSYTLAPANDSPADSQSYALLDDVNQSPVLFTPLINQAIQIDTLDWSYAAGTSFVDPDISDSLSFTATLANGDPLPLWLQMNATSGLVTGIPGLTDRGTYALNITATDNDGASVDAPLTVAVTAFNAGQLLVSTSGNNTLASTAANDTVTYGYASAAVTVSLATTTQQNTLGAGLDTLIDIDNLIGGDFNDNLTGNSKNNALDGGTGNDKLNGGGGADAMFGGPGNDSFVVNHTGDTVTEFLNEGTDKISSSVTYTLPVNVENLSLTGSSAINGTGNDQANTLIGNTGDNLLAGGDGNDKLDGKTGTNTLTGGAGKDTFKFTTTGHIDTITDFVVADDTIQLENTVFASLTTTGTLAADEFTTGTQALDANDFVIYNNVTGAILYDADGNGTGAAVQIAIVGTGLSMTNADFVVI